MRYKSKIDLWVAVLLWGSVLMFIPFYFIVPEEGYFTLTLSFVIMALLILPFLTIAYYVLEDDELIIRLGFFRQRIPYKNIKSLRLCTNLLSSMALSRYRIEIKEHDKGYIRGTTYISPVEREVFYRELKRLCPNLEAE